MRARRVVFCVLLFSARFGSAAGQDLGPFIAQCASGGSAELLTACQSAVLAAQAIRGGVTLTHTMGTDLAGSSSTIGRRLGSSPRVSLDVRLRMARFGMPDFSAEGTGTAGENDAYAYGVKGAVAVGVLDGFSLMPTVGGLLSLDLLASGSLVFLRQSDGFPGNGSLLSVGGRIGLLRESFTLPGVTVSVMQSFGKSVDWTTGLTGPQINADISATTIRATVGKDFFTLAVLAGFGWDWDRGGMGVQVPDPTIQGGQGVGLVEDLTTRRTVYFGGISFTRLVFQFSIEGGVSTGYDELAGYSGAYDPGGVTPFVSVAGRLTI